MMPGIGLHGRALDVAPDAVDITEQNFFYHDDHDQYPERERRRSVVRRENFAHAFNGQTERGEKHDQCDDSSCNWFCLPMTIGMRRIRRASGDFQPAPDHDGTADVQGRFDPVGDQDVSVPKNAGDNFYAPEHQIDGKAEQRNARPGLQIAGRSVRCRMLRERHRVKKNISAAVYAKHGNPADVLRVETQPFPRAAPGEAVVQMRAAPINPADLNQIEGKYPVRFPLPATPGFEGAGIVVDLGSSVTNVAIGALVILPHNVGTWREAIAVKANELVVVPSGIEPVHAAMLKINPMTAWRLLHDYVDLKKGDWLIQNAANSAAGRAVIQIAHELGYKTVNVVRRAELIDELRAEGGDVLLVDSDNLREEVKSATGGASIRLGLNSVGGDSALRLANCLAPGGTLVSFGAMSLQPLKIPTGLLIFKDLRFRGIWINKWYDNATMQERMDTFHALFEMAERGLLKTKVERSYPLTEAKAAVAHAAQGKRSGKIIFEFAA